MNESKIGIPFEIKELAPNTVYTTWKDYYNLNAGAIILNNYIVIIDSLSYPRQAMDFRKRIEEKYELPIKYLFLTHMHGDHVFGMSAFKDLEVIGSKALVENMKGKLADSWEKEAFDDWKKEQPELADFIEEIEITIPQKEFENEYLLEDGDLYIEFVNSGGHSSCSTYAYFPKDKTLFIGDEIGAGYWIFMSDPTGNPDKWIESFEEILKLDVEKIIPGHGPIVSKEYVKEQLEFMKELKKTVLKAISEGKKPEEVEVPDYPYEPAIDWQIPTALEFLFNHYSK
ncbi:MAG: MBL fold metallo-hydrolase [Asgard group archaeon]|nr:MBL fold metallo-hydrolase [Asgard group archaeon]